MESYSSFFWVWVKFAIYETVALPIATILFHDCGMNNVIRFSLCKRWIADYDDLKAFLDIESVLRIRADNGFDVNPSRVQNITTRIRDYVLMVARRENPFVPACVLTITATWSRLYFLVATKLKDIGSGARSLLYWGWLSFSIRLLGFRYLATIIVCAI